MSLPTQDVASIQVSEEKSFSDFDEDSDEFYEKCEQEHIQKLLANPYWVRYSERVNEFIKLLNENKILAQRDYACCGNCGNKDIDLLKTELEKKNPKHIYRDYLFYHGQTAEDIEKKLEDIEKDWCSEPTLEFYVQWGSLCCGKGLAKNTFYYNILAQRIASIANKVKGMSIKYDEKKGNSQCLLIVMDVAQ